MIVTSKRVFLNRFIQSQSAQTVLNANYYVADRKATGTGSMITPEIRRNEFGQLENVGTTYLNPTSIPLSSMYHIRIDNMEYIDPNQFATDLLCGAADGFVTAEERYIDHLNKNSTILGTYKFLFDVPLEGNGLQILIMEDDKNLLRFGHILCQYLSTMFGVDIVFLDPIHRPEKCHGYPSYKGSPQGLENIIKIKQYDKVFNFNQAVSQSEESGTVSNLREHLFSYEYIEDLMDLYNILYPDDPLPPGNYSIDQMRELLIYRALGGKELRRSEGFANLLINSDWETMVNRMSREASDFASDDTGLF